MSSTTEIYRIIEQLNEKQCDQLNIQHSFGVVDAIMDQIAVYLDKNQIAESQSIQNTTNNITKETHITLHQSSNSSLYQDSSTDQNSQTIISHVTNLQELRYMVEQYSKCTLKFTANQTVFGTGVMNPIVMMIGEGPGLEEDRVGMPFVGPSGRLIRRCLSLIGIDCQSNLYITNSVYWRPPADRTPTDIEIASCLPFLKRQIDLLQPKIILLVGACAAQSLLGINSGITRLRGSWFSLPKDVIGQDIPTLAIFHPAYLFRNHIQKKLFWQDIITLRRKIDEMDLYVPWPSKPLTTFSIKWYPK